MFIVKCKKSYSCSGGCGVEAVSKAFVLLFYWIILVINVSVTFFLCQRVSKKRWWWWWWGGRGGGGCVRGLPLYPLHALQVSFATTSVASLPACVCFFCLFACFFFFFFFFLGGGDGVRVPGLVGWEKTIESSRSFHYSQAFIHISKYENIDSDTDSVFTLDSAFKFSRHATKPELVWVFFSQIHYLDSRTRFDLNCFREISENIQRKARKVIFIEGG